MAETKNIAEMATILSNDLFGEFLWTQTGPTDTNWPCEDPEAHKAKTHPSDVVFYFDNPYELTRTYVNCDLKSYASGTITKARIMPAIESLGRTLACAEKSAEWQKRFSHEYVNHELCGLLFVYNHDGAYDKDFKTSLSDAKPKLHEMPKGSKLFVLGPEDIFWLNNVRYEIVQMRGKGVVPSREHCRFFYPNLVRKNNVQPDHARAATLEVLTGPWIVLTYTHPKTNRQGYAIFYRNKGDSVPEFLYLIDYLMSYQVLNENTDIHLRTLETDLNASAFFQKAIQEYTEQCDDSAEILELLRAITYAQINDIHTQFSEIEIGMDNG
jgi:hypothetical protein